MNEVEAVARAIFQRQYGDRTDAVWAEMWKWWNDPDVIKRGGPSEIVDSARAAIQALDEARGDGWRTIESAPRDGKFLAWHSGFNEARTVERFNMLDKPDTVINGASGKFFRAKWWRPLPAAPGAGT